MNAHTSKPRLRTKVGQDEAMRWARKLPINNPYAKSILRALANYMNEDGSAYPGLATLAEDTDINEDTIAKRLEWLQSIGAILIIKNWFDERGTRNAEGIGRPTSSAIRFLMDADREAIGMRAKASKKERELSGAAKASHEARRTGNPQDDLPSDSKDSDFCPPSHGEQTETESPPTSDRIATEQPPTASVRTEALEQESPTPTPPPKGAGSVAEQSVEEEKQDSVTEPKDWPHAESWAAALKAWGEPLTRPSICMRLWEAFTEPERDRFMRVMRGYNAWYAVQKRPPARASLQTLMRERESWAQFEERCPPDPKPAPPPPPTIWIPIESDEFAALSLMAAIARETLPDQEFSSERGGYGIEWNRSVLPSGGATSLAALTRRDPHTGEVLRDKWEIVEKPSNRFFAWRELASKWLGVNVKDQTIWLDENNCVVRSVHEAFRDPLKALPNNKAGLLVPPTPTGFPPAKGTSESQ
jgi:hypothetical protein